jgi:hypothetical protein
MAEMLGLENNLSVGVLLFELPLRIAHPLEGICASDRKPLAESEL